MDKKNIISDNELDTVSGGTMTDADKAWVEDLMWYCVENDYSWNDVVDNWFRDIEPYCNKVNAGRSPEDQVSPSEISTYMMEKYFDIGEQYINGQRRNSRKKR